MMNALTKTLACLALVGLAGVDTPYASEAVNVSRDVTSPTIKLAENRDGGGNNCSFPVKAENVELNNGDHGCKNDEMRWFKLEEVRSALRIVFESRNCDDEGGWLVVIRTTIDPLSTGWLNIDDLRNKKEGDIYTRGVLMERVDKQGDDDTSLGKVSCVRVIPSALPPPDTGKTGSE